MDIYAEVQSPDPAELINSPFGGRYCGPIPPRRRISLYRAIALSFYTAKNQTTPDVFDGRYQFINECKILPFLWILPAFFDGHQITYNNRTKAFPGLKVMHELQQILAKSIKPLIQVPTTVLILNSLNPNPSSRIRSRTASCRFAMFLCSQLCTQTYRFSRLTNVSRCLPKRYVVHISVHWKARPKGSNRIS